MQHHTCIDFCYNLNIHIMIINMSVVIAIYLEIVEKQNAAILNAMCIFQFRYNFYNYFFSSRKIITAQLNNVPIFFRLSGCVFIGRPLARGNWNAFQWSPTGRLKMKWTILWQNQ